MSAVEISEYWELVRACLIRIYDLSPEKAQFEVESLCQRLANGLGTNSPADGSSQESTDPTNLIYHSAPIHVASDLADPYRVIDETMWRRWQDILRRSKSQSRNISASEDEGLPEKEDWPDTQSARAVA